MSNSESCCEQHQVQQKIATQHSQTSPHLAHCSITSVIGTEMTDLRIVFLAWWTWWMLVALFLIIKPTRCTNFSNLFWKWNCMCFRQFLCPSSGVIHCTLSSGVGQLVCRRGWNCSLQTCWHIPLLSLQRITPDDGQRNFLKPVEFHFQNKFEKLVHLVGFIIRKFVTMHGHMNEWIKKK
jgi:hypothetical protein